MPKSALSDFSRPKFATKISTGFVEIFDSFRWQFDGRSGCFDEAEATVSCIVMFYSVLDHLIKCHRHSLGHMAWLLSVKTVFPRRSARVLYDEVRRQARLCPPILHNEQSSCRDIV